MSELSPGERRSDSDQPPSWFMGGGESPEVAAAHNVLSYQINVISEEIQKGTDLVMQNLQEGLVCASKTPSLAHRVSCLSKSLEALSAAILVMGQAKRG
jgi:hypothetical protein